MNISTRVSSLGRRESAKTASTIAFSFSSKNFRRFLRELFRWGRVFVVPLLKFCLTVVTIFEAVVACCDMAGRR